MAMKDRLTFFAVIVVALALRSVHSFSPFTGCVSASGCTCLEAHKDCNNSVNRRGAVATLADKDCNDSVNRRGAVATLAAQLFLPVATAQAVMDPSQSVFKIGQTLSVADAEARLKEGRKSAQYLLENYDKVCEGGGDNVRRYLGTVGTTSGLFGIGKVMNTLSEKAGDFVEYTEVSNEVLKAIQQADGSAYMAIFVTSSTSQTPPSKYFGDAKIEVKRCIKALDELADLIDLKIL